MLEMVIEVVIVDFEIVEVVVQDVTPNRDLGVIVCTVCILGTLMWMMSVVLMNVVLMVAVLMLVLMLIVIASVPGIW
jgi:hypothetical protein